MRWRETTEPVRMERVAVVAPQELLRDVLVRLADSGAVELDPPLSTHETMTPAARRLEELSATGGVTLPLQPLLAAEAVDLDDLVARGRADLLAGEASLQRQHDGATVRGEVAALPGWAVAAELPALRERLAAAGGGVLRLPTPRGTDPPTMLPVRGELRAALTPLVDTYGTVPYSDLDPTVVAGLAYVLMFGMMFGDVGHGLLLVVAGLALRAGRPRRFPKVHRAWPFVLGAGVAATLLGALYGEFFGPTGVVPPLWLDPMAHPVQLLVAGIGVGAVLLAGAYALGTVNRWREGGWPVAVYAPSGIAGFALFLGLATVALGVYADLTWVWLVGGTVWCVALVLVFVGLLATSEGGATGVVQAVVELFDSLIRVGSNLLSFARLAAFGLTHAALAGLVWDATSALTRAGPVAWLGAALVFAVGNVVAFSLEALVAAIQALRLEYYELFSRVFQAEGRPFQPWHIATDPASAGPVPAEAGPAEAGPSGADPAEPAPTEPVPTDLVPGERRTEVLT